MPDPSVESQRHTVRRPSDPARARYERLRQTYLAEGLEGVHLDCSWELLSQWGFLGLFERPPRTAYSVHVHRVPRGRWIGLRDTEQEVWREVFQVLTSERGPLVPIERLHAAVGG